MNNKNTLQSPAGTRISLNSAIGKIAGLFGHTPKAKEKADEVMIEDFGATIRELASGGFETVTTAAGPWIVNDGQEVRLLRQWALHNPNGAVVAVTQYKFVGPNGMTVRSSLYRKDFETTPDYDSYITEFGATQSEGTPISELVATLPPETAQV